MYNACYPEPRNTRIWEEIKMVASFVGLQTTHKVRGTEFPQICCGTEDSWLSRKTSCRLHLFGRQHSRDLANNMGDGGRVVKSPIGIKKFKSAAKPYS